MRAHQQVLASRARLSAWWGPLGILLVLGTAAAAQTAVVQDPKLAKEYAKLQTEVEQQTGSRQAETLARMAEFNYAFADASYRAQQPEAAEQQLDLATQHADAACALLQAEADRGKTNGMKHVEESLQRIVYNLNGLAQQVLFRQRPRVEAAADHFADLRAKVLQWMFQPKKL